MKKGVFCGLDIGSSKLTAVLARVQNGKIELLCSDILPVQGLCKGVVKDLSSLADCIQRILNSLNAKAKVKIRGVLVGVNGDYINARSSFAAVVLSERANRHITASDIKHLRYQARLLGLRIDEFLLHEFPQDYILDDNHNTVSPLGLLARKIQLNSYLLSVPHSLWGNIQTAIQQAGYEVENTIFSGVASSFSVISEEEKTKGVILIDLGACFTNLLFFKDGILRDFKMIPFGGNNITDDISSGLELPWDLAEEIKKSSLILSAADLSDSDTVVIRRSGSYKTLERRKVYETAKARLEEFLCQIKEAIDSSVWKDKAECGIVGVGGGANLEGILERIEFHTKIQVRLGHIKKNASIGERSGLQYAAAVGLLYHRFNFKDSLNLRGSFIGRTHVEKAVNFVRHLYREYF